MNTRREALLNEAMQTQKRVYLSMQEATVPTWLQLDLSMAQVKTFFLLSRDQAMTISQVARALGIKSPAASILVDRLVQLGLVDRAEDPEDRRRTYARLTPRGKELMARLRQGAGERVQAWFGRLSDAELAALAQGLQALEAAIAADRAAVRV